MKILYVVNSLNVCNGITSAIMNYYKRFDHSLIKCDFVIHTKLTNNSYIELIKANGDNIYYIGDLNLLSLPNTIKNIKAFLDHNHNYDVIHCHLQHVGYYYMKYAEKYNIKKRIIHIHNPRLSEGFFSSIRNRILLNKTYKYANSLAACSKTSGDSIFGKSRKYWIMKNAFDYNLFFFDRNERKRIREKLNCINSLVIGFVGRFTKQKNVFFVIDCFEQVLKQEKNARLIMVGSGPQLNVIKKYVLKRGLYSNVTLVAPTNNINSYYSAFDVLLMPSLFEGLGLVSVEAQINGLEVLHSEFVPDETNVGGAKVIQLNRKDLWVKEILNCKARKYNIIVNRSFDINRNLMDLIQQYEKE